jgi:DNA-damage-inducible protein D
MQNKKVAENHIVVFNDMKIRRILHQGEWWFSVIDVIQVLTDSSNPRDYWYKMKIRVNEEDTAELSTFCRQLKLEAPDGNAMWLASM